MLTPSPPFPLLSLPHVCGQASGLGTAQFLCRSITFSECSLLHLDSLLGLQFGRFLPPDTLAKTNYQMSLTESAREIPQIKIVGVVQWKWEVFALCLTSLSFICSLGVLNIKRQSSVFKNWCALEYLFVLFSRLNSPMSKQQINQRPSSMVSESSTAVTMSAVDTKPGSKVKETDCCLNLMNFTCFKANAVLVLISIGPWIKPED